MGGTNVFKVEMLSFLLKEGCLFRLKGLIRKQIKEYEHIL